MRIPGLGGTHINEDPGPRGTHISEDPRPRGLSYGCLDPQDPLGMLILGLKIKLLKKVQLKPKFNANKLRNLLLIKP